MRTEYLLKREEKVEKWGEGIWTDEPDEAEWIDETTGLPCLVIRNMEVGTFAGYIGVPLGHPFYGRKEPEEADAHRGITFAGRYEELGIISRVPANARRGERAYVLPGKADPAFLGYWFLGFDCGHAGDLMPQLRKLIPSRAAEPLLIASRHEALDMFTDIYKDFVWVRERVERLAASAAEARPIRTAEFFRVAPSGDAPTLEERVADAEADGKPRREDN